MINTNFFEKLEGGGGTEEKIGGKIGGDWKEEEEEKKIMEGWRKEEEELKLQTTSLYMLVVGSDGVCFFFSSKM